MLIYLFLRETEKESERAWVRGIERQRQNIQSRLCVVSAEPDTGLDPTSVSS